MPLVSSSLVVIILRTIIVVERLPSSLLLIKNFLKSAMVPFISVSLGILLRASSVASTNLFKLVVFVSLAVIAPSLEVGVHPLSLVLLSLLTIRRTWLLAVALKLLVGFHPLFWVTKDVLF
jgi:hypothetical protein